MNYEAMVRETDKMIRDIMFREQIAEWVLWWLCAVLAVIVAVAWVQQRKARKVERMAKVVGGFRYAPNVTDDVQMVGDVEFHRMGVPGRE